MGTTLHSEDWASFLLDDNNKFIFDDDEPMTIKRCKLSPEQQVKSIKISPLPITKSSYRKRTKEEKVKKNSRERLRRAGMGIKFKELYDICCSGMVTAAISTSNGLQIPVSAPPQRPKVDKPTKVLVLTEAIKAIHS